MNDMEISLEDIEALKRINNQISRSEVIQWFNDSDIDYFNMTDIEMYIHYLQKAERWPNRRY